MTFQARWFMLSTVIASFLSVAGCGDDGEGSSPRAAAIGLLFPLTGETSFVANARNGALVAFDEINEGAGGIRIGNDRVKLTSFTEDSGNDPQTGQAAATTVLTKSEVIALVGLTSTTIVSVIPLAQEAGAVVISPFAGTTAIDTRGGCIADECVFRTVSSDVVMGSGMSFFADQTLGAENVAFFFADDAGARSIQGVLADAAQILGFDVVGEVFLEPGQDSYADELATVLAGDPDVIFFEASSADSAVFLEDGQSAGFDGHWVGTDFVNGLLVESAGSFSEGVYGVNPGVILDERYAEWVEDYERVIGSSTIAQFSPNTYDAVNLVALALEKDGEISRQAVRQNLRDVATPPGVKCRSFLDCAALLRQGLEIDYDGISGPQDFNEFGDPISPLKAEQVQNGELVRLETITQDDIGDLIEQVRALRNE